MFSVFWCQTIGRGRANLCFMRYGNIWALFAALASGDISCMSLVVISFKVLNSDQQHFWEIVNKVCSSSINGDRGSQGFRWSKWVFSLFLIEASEGYQMLFTGSKNIDPSPSYRILKFAIYIQLHCGRALSSRLSQNLSFWP